MTKRVKSIRILRAAGSKLRSDRGASITMALLFFIVCAVIGSVVLAAGSASAGRMSSMTATDQRYFSVSSAAQLIREQIEGSSVTVVSERTILEEVTREYYLNAEGEAETRNTATTVSSDPLYPRFSAQIDGVSISRGSSLLADAAIDLIFGQDTYDFASQTAWDHTIGTVSSAVTKDLVIDPKIGGASDPDLLVDVHAVLNTDGTMTLSFTNTNGSEKYTLIFTCTPHFSTQNSEHQNSLSYSVVEKEPETNIFISTESLEVTSVRTNTVTWTVSEISKG